MEEPIRILSDLHLGHTASLARDVAQIEPLFRDVRTVIFNGDTTEMRSEKSRDRAEAIMQAVHEFCHLQDAATYFINGNHDPIISTINHMEIDDGRLLVTHGDVLFHDHEHPYARQNRRRHRRHRMHDRMLADLTPEELANFERILSTRKRVSALIEESDFNIPNGPWGRFSSFMKQTWPPHRLVHLVTSWRNTPVHAVNLVRVYRPRTRCIVVGHTHYPGIWHRDGYTVINTGSYLPMLGRLAVDFANGHVTVRKVVFRRGQFHLGRVIGQIHTRRPMHAAA